MEEKLSGIVISSISYGENDKILNIFTPDKGVISAKIKGVKKATAKLKFAKEPFCFAEFIFSSTTKGRTVIGASLIDSFYPLREDINKYFCAGAVVEFIKKFYKENILSPDAFFIAVSALKEIAYGDALPQVALIRYLILALKEEGHALDLSGCGGCGGDITGRIFFDYRQGAFYCKECAGEGCREISLLTFNTLKSILEGAEVKGEGVLKGLKLLDFYLENEGEESLSSLKETIKIFNYN